MRHFSLGNPDISFPHMEDTVSATVLIIVSCLVPAAIIVFVCLVLVPGPTVPKSVPKSLIWKRKLWEWFTGWLGLGMSCAGTWFITRYVLPLPLYHQSEQDILTSQTVLSKTSSANPAQTCSPAANPISPTSPSTSLPAFPPPQTA